MFFGFYIDADTENLFVCLDCESRVRALPDASPAAHAYTAYLPFIIL